MIHRNTIRKTDEMNIEQLTSSGHIVSLKVRRSSGSGKTIWQVFGRLSSFISVSKITNRHIWRKIQHCACKNLCQYPNGQSSYESEIRCK